MYIKRGKYHIVSNPFHPRTLIDISQENIAEYEKALDTLSTILGEDFSWRLAGGLAIAVTIGRWYRVHRDIDILVSINDFSVLIEKARMHGYALFSRPWWVRLPLHRKIDIYKASTPSDALNDTSQCLRLVKVDGNETIMKHIDLLHHIDIYIYCIVDGEMVFAKFPRRLPTTCLDGRTYTTRSGRKMPVVHLKYIERVKSIGFGRVDRHDLAQIRMWALSQNSPSH